MKAIDLKIFIISIIFFIIFVIFFENLVYSNLYNQLILFSIPLIWPGLAHGSIDIFTAKRFNLIKSNKSLIFFLTIYISIPILFFYFWLKFPNLFFVFFLILSGLHFGISDRQSKSFLLKNMEVLLRAIIIIILPVWFYTDEIKEIFLFFFVSDNFITSFYYWSEFFLYLAIFILILFLISFLLKKISKNLIIEIILLIFCFTYFKPLVSFLIYFCFLHSIRHLLYEKLKLNLSLKRLVLNTLPMTVFSCLFIFFLIITENQSIIFNISHIVIAISSLTISHIFLVNFLKED